MKMVLNLWEETPTYEVVIKPYQIWPTSDAADFMTTFWAFLAHFTSSFERDPL